MSIRNLEQAFQGNDWNISITPPEHPEDRKSRIQRQAVAFYALIAASFLMASVLLYITYHPPAVDGASNKTIQENAFHAFVLFFTSCVSLWIGKQTK